MGGLMHQIQRGFTLVELLIVVIILAILAAIVVPQFAASTDDAKASALDATLANMRAVIDLYYQQHNEYPGAVTAVPGASCTTTLKGTGTAADATNRAQAFMDQLSLYTNAAGQACASPEGGAYPYGPYLKKSKLPDDPYMGVGAEIAELEVIITGELGMIASGVAGGWKFDNQTGQFIMNHTTYDDR